MKVKNLIRKLKKLPPNDDIVITAMDDDFYCSDFVVHSAYDDGQAQEIILGVHIEKYFYCD